MTSKTYDYKAFIAIYINTRGYEKHNAEWKAYYVEYYVRLFDILKEFFKIRFHFIEFFAQSESMEDERIGALALFTETIHSYILFRPSGVWLAVSNGYTDLRTTHYQTISRLEQELKEAYLGCLYQLFEFMYGNVELVVTSEMLKEKGFDDSVEPNRMDFIMEEYDKSKLWWMNDK